MKIFYGKSAGFEDVKAASAKECGVDEAFAIFRSLDAHRGFMGVQVDAERTVQLFMVGDQSQVRLELVNSDTHRIDRCTISRAQAEELLRVADENHDVFAWAGQWPGTWERLE